MPGLFVMAEHYVTTDIGHFSHTGEETGIKTKAMLISGRVSLQFDFVNDFKSLLRKMLKLDYVSRLCP